MYTITVVDKNQIIQYYDQTKIDYQLIWHLNSQMAMHLGFWDKTTHNLPQALQKENEVLSQIVQVKKRDLVLDAGCGVGGSSIYLAKKYGCKVMGITLSQDQVEEAQENAAKNKVDHLTKFGVMDFTATHFKNEVFDVVWAIESVCHAGNKQKFIKEAFRILKKEGRLILADGFTVKNNFTQKEQELIDKWLKGWGVEFLENKQNFQIWLELTGFTNIHYFNITKNIMPSSKLLYWYSFPALITTLVAQAVGVRTKVQTNNVLSAYYQYQVLKRNLCEYGIFYAQKR